MIADSVSSWRMMRRRPAPRAARIEISRWRTDARASSRLATFEHAITSTSVTAPIIARITSSTCSGIIQSAQRPDDGAPALVLVRIRGRETANHAARHRSSPARPTRRASSARTPAETRTSRAVDSKYGASVTQRRCVSGKHELRRHDADDGVGKAVDGNRPADDRAVAVVSQLPHLVAEHDDALGAGTVVVGGEVAPERRRRSEEAEERRRDRRRR